MKNISSIKLFSILQFDCNLLLFHFILVAGTTSLLLLFGRLLLSHVIIPQLMTDNRVGVANEESNIAKQGNSEGDKVSLDFIDNLPLRY